MGIISKSPLGPPPASAFNNLPTAPTPPVTPTEPTQTAEQAQAEARSSSLLRRSRGRLGTVLSGFRGFLSSGDGNEKQSRKTLLGE